MSVLHLEVITPLGKVFAGDVKSVTLPGADGEFGVLPHHASLLSLLAAGVIEIQKDDDRTESIAIDAGYAEIAADKMIVLVDGAVPIKGESESEVAKALDAAKQLLREAHDSRLLLSAVESKIETSARSQL
ncbi:MAG: F0F1 ATP synthase subunit epsilon [Helicobacteraceae bacterium]|jgi:F-type H+-transporting ATPase subunit epsilon|nr:F0F1 ATP synthase subunit epsilon [Helicobacteraceae bacterium]